MDNKMVFYKDITNDILNEFLKSEYWCFDTETCCHTEELRKSYFEEKIIPSVKGKHVRVYAWGLSNTITDTVIYGNTLEEFIELLNIITDYILEPLKAEYITKKLYNEIKKRCKIEIGVHNLKYDAEFLKYSLIDMNFNYFNNIIIDGKKQGRNYIDECFNITENTGIVYGLDIFTKRACSSIKKRNKENEEVTLIVNFSFFDTLKIMSDSLDNIAKKVIKIDEKYYKLSTVYDYESVRPIGHKLTDLEKQYLYNDVYILKEFLRQFYIPLGVTQKTASSIAFNVFTKDIWGSKATKEFTYKYPNMYEYNFIDRIKNSYKGGWTFTYSDYKGKHLKNIHGVSIDINSSYPSVIANKPLPYGVPWLFDGYEPSSDNTVNLLTIEFNGFYNKHKNDRFGFFQASYLNMIDYASIGTDYLCSNIIDGELQGYSTYQTTTGKRFRYYIWEFELESIMAHTQFIDLEVVETLQFQCDTGFFNDTVDKYIELKNKGKKEGNQCMTVFAKLVLNSFYGKLGSNVLRSERTLVSDGDLLKFENTDIEYESLMKYYPPFASCVTAWARCNLRDTCYKLCINSNGEFEANVLYCDTDSIYSLLTSEEIIKRCGDIIDKYKLGAWDLEKTYNEFKCIGSKKYMYTELDGTVNCKCAGLPKEARKKVTYKNFHLGAEFEGKLALKKVPGGYLLIPTKFKLNNNIRF